MNSLSVLSAFNLSAYVFKPLPCGTVPFQAACLKAAAFPHCKKLLILTSQAEKDTIQSFFYNSGFVQTAYEIKTLENKSSSEVFSAAAKTVADSKDLPFENVFFLHADTPFIDVQLAEKLFERHVTYKAEYSFTDGYPVGLSPEIVSAGLCGILARTAEGGAGRNFIFETVKKDINNYDIETVVAPHDMRYLRLTLAADSKRNFLLCADFCGITAENYAEFIAARSEKLFTLPAYYSVEVMPVSPLCSIYKPKMPVFDPMDKDKLFDLIEKIARFSDDAVISLSIFGEPLFYPYLVETVAKIISYPSLSVLIETSGLCADNTVLEKIAASAKNMPKRKNNENAVYWIVTIDAVSSAMYAEVHKISCEQAKSNLKQAVTFTDAANKLFPGAVWAQTVRMNENEAETEPFYRFWKELGVQVIVQKFDTFCKTLDDKRVADLAPFERRPCWHLKRDMYILSDGTVPLCKEDVMQKHILGNVFSDSFESIREKAFTVYKEHLNCEYGGLCGLCDEYYTYNF